MEDGTYYTRIIPANSTRIPTSLAPNPPAKPLSLNLFTPMKLHKPLLTLQPMNRCNTPSIPMRRWDRFLKASPQKESLQREVCKGTQASYLGSSGGLPEIPKMPQSLVVAHSCPGGSWRLPCRNRPQTVPSESFAVGKKGLGLRVWGLGFRVSGLGFRV